MENVKLFLAPRMSEKGEDLRIVRAYKELYSSNLLYKDFPKDFRFRNFEYVEDIAQADFVLAPQPIRQLGEKEEKYLTELRALAKQVGREPVVFLGGDLSYKLHIPGVIAVGISVYKSEKLVSEIMAPVYSEDLAEQMPITWRTKGEKPVVSFCGYAGFPNWKNRINYYLRNVGLDLLSLTNPLHRAHKRGIYYRRVAMRALARDPRIDSRFIVRDFFSGNPKLMKISGEQARKEYLENMSNSDFVLCPRGEANISTRFYESLSLGRIPVLIDTEVVLPLEKVIDYSKFIIRVPYTDIKNVSTYVLERFHALSNEDFLAMQKAARAAYDHYLRFDAFFSTAFPLLKERGPEAS